MSVLEIEPFRPLTTRTKSSASRMSPPPCMSLETLMSIRSSEITQAIQDRASDIREGKQTLIAIRAREKGIDLAPYRRRLTVAEIDDLIAQQGSLCFQRRQRLFDTLQFCLFDGYPPSRPGAASGSPAGNRCGRRGEQIRKHPVAVGQEGDPCLAVDQILRLQDGKHRLGYFRVFANLL